MKIYTRTGDQGETGLFGGERVAKDHPRLAAYGAIDELNACVGWLRATPLDRDLDSVLAAAQHRLFDIGAELASPDPSKLKGRGQAVQAADVTVLEQAIDRFCEELTPLVRFILPGGTEGAARAHMVRTVCRRAERAVVALSHQYAVSEDTLRYLNRFSDLIFVLARVVNRRAAEADVVWEKRE